jgi:type I restriction-modification system DNA methylase subunit
MSKNYSCDLCKKVFKQSSDLNKHKNKKAPCISIDDIKEISKKENIKTDNKTTLINFFKSLLNILRDNEGLTGEKALRNMSYLLTLKLIEPQLDGEIDIDNYNYDFSHLEDDCVEHHRNTLLKFARFSNLKNEKEDDIPNRMKYLWNDILSIHPATKNIFLKGKGFDIQRQSTYKKIIDKLSSIDLSENDYDILGNAYEEVIQDIMTGKVLGQFFTQPLVKKMMVELINPQIYPDGKIDTCVDPAMGTGGFLNTYLQYILQQATTKNIKPDWDFIKTEGLYGKELEPDTYQLAVSNMLISSGHMFEKLDRGDSIRDPITRKFDNILANPPFGIKGLKYDDFQSSLKSEYIPIKTDNAVSLFIQAIIYMLKIGGKCAVVLPDGQDLFSKTNKTLVAIREYLMKTCDLKEIIYLPSGIFTYTTIKTCVFYFVKKREGTDVLETDIKYSKVNQKETSRNYKFSKTHQTTKIKFYDYNPYEDIKNLLVEVPIEKIVSNSYSLNYTEYMKDETEEEHYEEGVVVKTLGEVCSIDYGTRIVRKDNVEGEYPVYGSGRAMFSTETFNREGFNILIGRFALSLECVRFITEKIFLNDSGLSIKPKTDILLHKYIGYYLLHNQSIIYNCARGTAQKNLEMDIFKSIKIPIPSLEHQEETVKYLDFIYEKANKTSIEKIAELKRLNEFCLSNQKIFGENDVKTLGEVFKFETGKNKASECDNNGDYMFITNADNKTHSTYSIDGENLFICKINASKVVFKTKIKYYNGKCCYSSLMSRLKPIMENISLKYYYYYFNSIITHIEFFNKGVANKTLDIELLSSTLKIPIPSLERQKEIVEYCEYNDKLIKQLETEIENNKKQAQLFIRDIVKLQVHSEEEFYIDDEDIVE